MRKDDDRMQDIELAKLRAELAPLDRRVAALNRGIEQIERRRRKDKKKSRRTVPLESLLEEPAATPPMFDVLMASDLIEVILSKLPLRERAALRATALFGMTADEASRVFGMSPRSVELLKQRGLKRARQQAESP